MVRKKIHENGGKELKLTLTNIYILHQNRENSSATKKILNWEGGKELSLTCNKYVQSWVTFNIMPMADGKECLKTLLKLSLIMLIMDGWSRN